jgi:hypothetical protein
VGCRDAARREFDMVMAWSVDRLGRSLQDLVGFLSELRFIRLASLAGCLWIWGGRAACNENTGTGRTSRIRCTPSPFWI